MTTTLEKSNRVGRPLTSPEGELMVVIHLRLGKNDHRRLKKIAGALEKTGSALLREAWGEYADKYLRSSEVL